MFYYPNVLQRHTGCFSTIWLAATKGIRITRREFLKVNIRRTCDDIMDYLQIQVPPPHPSLPRPRFSLYLSSQLQYGVVIVYHRQCAFLLVDLVVIGGATIGNVEEVQNTIERLLRYKRHTQIDMQEMDRLTLDIPDSLFLLEEVEGALEPFFGVMGVDCELSIPCQLPQSWQFMETLSPELPRHLVTNLTVSPETITIKDKEPLSIPTAEFGGAELPEATPREINMLLHDENRFLITGELEDKERERERETEEEGWREGEAAMVSIEQLKETEDRSRITEDSGWLMQVVKQMDSLEKTPPRLTVQATRESSERDLEQNKDTECSSSEIPEVGILPGHCCRQRKRQLIFADQHTQISQEAMREQISNPLAETLTMSDVLLQVPPMVRSILDLFSLPCNAFFHPDFMSLWKQCCASAYLPPLPRKRRLQEPIEPPVMEGEQPPEEGDQQWRRRESSREVLRASSEVGLLLSEVSAASDVVLDESKEDKSQNDLITPICRRSPMDEATVHMEAILEECVGLPHTSSETGEVTLLRMLDTYMHHFGEVSFQSLLPPEADRSIAAHVFNEVLELVFLKKMWVRQTEPYGLITLGNRPL